MPKLNQIIRQRQNFVANQTNDSKFFLLTRNIYLLPPSKKKLNLKENVTPPRYFLLDWGVIFVFRLNFFGTERVYSIYDWVYLAKSQISLKTKSEMILESARPRGCPRATRRSCAGSPLKGVKAALPVTYNKVQSAGGILIHVNIIWAGRVRNDERERNGR